MTNKAPRFLKPGKHLILLATLTFFAVVLIWAKFASLDEVAKAEGKVIPLQRIQVVQNLEGGILKNIFVHEGQIVEKDQILMELDDIRFASEFRETELKRNATMATMVRLTAEVNNQPLVFPADLEKQAPQSVATEKALYYAHKEEMASLIEQKQFLENELHMTEPLIKEGAESQVELLRLKQRISELQGRILRINSENLDNLNKAQADFATLEQNIIKFKDRLQRTAIRSPVRGIVKQIDINTIGGVVKPAMDLIDIVPLGDTLLIEAKMKPANIGFIHPGQDALVKITAYDYTIYGGLNGIVENISADTTEDEKGNSFYHIRVRTQKSYLGSKEKPLNIIPGMQASVDILTGQKTVLEYLLKPLLRAKQGALRER